jgi:DNA transformation protein
MDAEALKALFEPVGAVSVKRMFGGHGVYADGLCFAIQSQGEVYLKTDAESEKVYADAGSAPFVYVARGKPMATSYWRLVASAYDDADELKRWSALAIEAARRVAAAKAAKPYAKKPKATRTPPAKAVDGGKTR